MDQFADRLARLADLGDDELAQLEQELVAAFDDADSNGDVDTMSQCADALDATRAEETSRQSTSDSGADASAPAADAAPAVAASAATDVIDPPVEAEVTETTTDEVTAPSAEAPDAEVETEADPADGDTPSDEVVPEVEAEATATSEEDTTASQEEASMDDVLTAADAPDDAQPDAEAITASGPVTVIRAGGDIPGYASGAPLESMDDVAEVLCAKINSNRHATGGNGEQVVVASLSVPAEDLPEDRILRPGDANGNAAKIRKALEPEAITAAANGWCAPRMPIYSIFGIGDSARPVRDSLTSFSAERGGIVWSVPPKLSDAGWGSGTWVWDGDSWASSSDPATANGVGTSKILYEATCPNESTADLETLTSQLKFTNMMARAYPELVKRNMELALIAHARFCETRLLRAMWAASTKQAETATPVLGALRDMLVNWVTRATGFRSEHRMDDAAPLDLVAPSWFRVMCALDLNVQAPGDDKLGAGMAEIDGYLATHNLNPVWFRDEMAGFATSQLPSEEAFPASVASILSPPGTYLHMDGGTLDLGVVRDADLVGTNQYIEFTETFEQIAMVGVGSLGISQAVSIRGATAAAVATTSGHHLA